MLEYHVVDHVFRPGETIIAVIRNLHNYNITPEEITSIILIFNKLNSNKVPVPGVIFKIPILNK